MKHFKFFCTANKSYKNTIDETAKICSYLSVMYEYYLNPVKTGGISTLIIYFGDKKPENIVVFPIMSHFISVDWSKIEAFSSLEKANFILEQCNEVISFYVHREQWDNKPFQLVYKKVKKNNYQFREHFKKPILSPNKEFKAQIYFELDYEKNGTFVDFTDKSGNLINRIQFTPSGYSVISKTIGNIEWLDNNQVKIGNIQVPKLGINADCNRKKYWLVKMDG
ncbi:hypothetical protein [Flavobacterium sp.]|uniref:hypothetical protein n=1 Tax=Flavobacterium sp. TaxID=239 RepID=UPI0031E03B71